MLLTGSDPLRIYLYNEGLGRLATEPYVNPSKANLNTLYMHLTNYSINKNNKNFIFNDDKDADDVGHKRSLTSVLQTLEDEEGVDTEQLMNKIKDVIIKTICMA